MFPIRSKLFQPLGIPSTPLEDIVQQAYDRAEALIHYSPAARALSEPAFFDWLDDTLTANDNCQTLTAAFDDLAVQYRFDSVHLVMCKSYSFLAFTCTCMIRIVSLHGLPVHTVHSSLLHPSVHVRGHVPTLSNFCFCTTVSMYPSMLTWTRAQMQGCSSIWSGVLSIRRAAATAKPYHSVLISCATMRGMSLL